MDSLELCADLWRTGDWFRRAWRPDWPFACFQAWPAVGHRRPDAMRHRPQLSLACLRARLAGHQHGAHPVLRARARDFPLR